MKELDVDVNAHRLSLRATTMFDNHQHRMPGWAGGLPSYGGGSIPSIRFSSRASPSK